MADLYLKALESERRRLWAECRLKGLAKGTAERLRIKEIDRLLADAAASYIRTRLGGKAKVVLLTHDSLQFLRLAAFQRCCQCWSKSDPWNAFEPAFVITFTGMTCCSSSVAAGLVTHDISRT